MMSSASPHSPGLPPLEPVIPTTFFTTLRASEGQDLQLPDRIKGLLKQISILAQPGPVLAPQVPVPAPLVQGYSEGPPPTEYLFQDPRGLFRR